MSKEFRRMETFYYSGLKISVGKLLEKIPEKGNLNQKREKYIIKK